ncbi:hypothetical protein WKI13_01155 [Teredinibacter turnerae]|uniref:hypothetical protein n=1 Tax=Teredinibacter turnerae TaxID=2426 RepID=UPI00038233D1|nr:hypothetical protein [Teredinibacter turnerae]
MSELNGFPSIEDICARMEVSIKEDLKMSLSQVSGFLGYSNQSPLTRIINKKGFIGPDRLGRFATLKTADGGTPNVNWILTGKGERTVVKGSLDSKARQVVELLGEEKLRRLLELLSSDGATT